MIAMLYDSCTPVVVALAIPLVKRTRDKPLSEPVSRFRMERPVTNICHKLTLLQFKYKSDKF